MAFSPAPFATVTAKSTSSTTGWSTPINTSGAHLIVCVVAHYFAAASGLEDSYFNSWTLAAEKMDVAGRRVGIYYCFNPKTGGNHKFRAGVGSDYPALAVAAYGATVPQAVNATSAGNASSPGSTVATGAVVPTKNGALIIAAAMSDPDQTIDSIDAGFAIVVSAPGTGGTAYAIAAAALIQSSAASVNPTFTLSGSTYCVAVAAAFTCEDSMGMQKPKSLRPRLFAPGTAR